MGVRELKYEDYGLTLKDIDEARELCKKPENFLTLMDAAAEANESISVSIAYSLAYKVSYEKMLSSAIIPYAKKDFYAYQRKTLAIFAKSLKIRPQKDD